MASPKREMTGGRQGARRDCKLVAKMKLPHRESTALREIRGRKGRIGEARRCDNIVLSFLLPFPSLPAPAHRSPPSASNK